MTITLRVLKLMIVSMATLSTILFAGQADAYNEEVWTRSGNNLTGLVKPLSLQDITGKHNIGISLFMVPADNVFGLSSVVNFQYAKGISEVELFLPWAIAVPDHMDSQGVLGNFGLDIKLFKCIDGNVRVCLGGAVAASFGVMEIFSKDESLPLPGQTPNNDNSKPVVRLMAWSMGTAAYHEPLYFSPETSVLRPHLFSGLMWRGLFSQAEIGSEIGIPLLNTKGRDVETMLVYKFALGYRVIDWFAPMAEVAGWTLVSGKDRDTNIFINIGARFETRGGFAPAVMISIPTEKYKGMDASVYAGISLSYGWKQSKSIGGRRTLLR
ncbi:MAG: hypothetical protein GXP49_11670 [Deltaproteobacteria bacterium]|nr:hypothetical protein [Deltaproteobacteria bacterium]